MPRRKGSKNKKSICLKSLKAYPMRFYIDLEEWVNQQENVCEYVNALIRKDYEEHLENQMREGINMGNVNAYNFVENGCVFYHVIAESVSQCYELAQGAGYDIKGMTIELERMNVRDELGKPYPPKIEECI